MQPTTAIADRATESTDVESGQDPHGETLIDDELVIEEISIDGMCGVY